MEAEADRVKHYRAKAEEARKLASSVSTPGAKRVLLELVTVSDLSREGGVETQTLAPVHPERHRFPTAK
jgi:hypothetical protein